MTKAVAVVLALVVTVVIVGAIRSVARMLTNWYVNRKY